MIETAGSKAHYIMIGGFLGAGKTTAVARLARRLTDAGQRVGLITNDQSHGLVDTAILRSEGFNVEEIAGGCFCCRFDSLLDAARKLTEENRPDVFLAEPVGSCTDLVATVSYPLRRIYGDRFSVAPLSVLVDPIRAARVMGIEPGRSFSSKVVYVYRKQLEEADMIVINKSDLVAEPLRLQLDECLRESFPRATLFHCSARQGLGLDDWFDRLLAEVGEEAATMDVDYGEYAEGEALLGWLNCTVRLSALRPFDVNATLVVLCRAIRGHLEDGAGEIAHLKMTYAAHDADGNLSVVNLVRHDVEPDVRESLLDRSNGGTLVINLRAEAAPELLERATRAGLDACTKRDEPIVWTVEHWEQLRPGRPTPTHRVVVPSGLR